MPIIPCASDIEIEYFNTLNKKQFVKPEIYEVLKVFIESPAECLQFSTGLGYNNFVAMLLSEDLKILNPLVHYITNIIIFTEPEYFTHERDSLLSLVPELLPNLHAQ